MPPIARSDTNTLFHIDLNWFGENARDLRHEMHNALCNECRTRYPNPDEARVVDRVHPQTGEVQRVDALWECLADHCGHLPEFIDKTTPLTAAIFRAFLAGGNHPMSPEQLYQRVGKSNPAGILKLLNGSDIGFGIVRANEAK